MGGSKNLHPTACVQSLLLQSSSYIPQEILCGNWEGNQLTPPPFFIHSPIQKVIRIYTNHQLLHIHIALKATQKSEAFLTGRDRKKSSRLFPHKSSVLHLHCSCKLPQTRLLGVHGNTGITLMTSKSRLGFGFLKGSIYELHLYRGKQTPHTNNTLKNRKMRSCVIFADSQMHTLQRGIKHVPCPVLLFMKLNTIKISISVKIHQN